MVFFNNFVTQNDIKYKLKTLQTKTYSQIII
jgi:hypothetical protein